MKQLSLPFSLFFPLCISHLNFDIASTHHVSRLPTKTGLIGSCISCYLQHEISGNTEGISTTASSEQNYDVRWEAPHHAVITRLEPSIALLGSFYKYFIGIFGLMSCISDTGWSVSG